MKDWTGNKNSIYKTLGASNHTEKEREEHDFYETDPIAAELLCDVEPLSERIWECAAGCGALSKVLEKRGHAVYSTDLIDRGYGDADIDFLKCDGTVFYGDIVTNPPYKYAEEFIRKALSIVADDGNKVCMFLKIQFLEGKSRRKLFDEFPPKTVYVSSSRIMCAKNGDFEGMKKGGGSACCFAWYVWEKGYKGTTELKWIN